MAPTKVPGAAALAQEADVLLRALIDALRQQQEAQRQRAQGGGGGEPGVPPPSGPVLIVLVKALSVVAVQRPGLLGRVLPALVTLAKEVRRGGVRGAGYPFRKDIWPSLILNPLK